MYNPNKKAYLSQVSGSTYSSKSPTNVLSKRNVIQYLYKNRYIYSQKYYTQQHSPRNQLLHIYNPRTTKTNVRSVVSNVITVQ
jgi:hypothetical protein